MKKKKFVIIIISLLLLLGISLLIWYLVIANKTKEETLESNYVCSRIGINTNTDQLAKVVNEQIIYYDETTTTGFKASTKYTYKTKELYENTKKWNQQASYNYIYNDDTLTTTITDKEIKKITNEKNEVINIAVNDYIKSLEENGYTCTKSN